MLLYWAFTLIYGLLAKIIIFNLNILSCSHSIILIINFSTLKNKEKILKNKNKWIFVIEMLHKLFI